MHVEQSVRPVIVAGLGILILSCMDAAMKAVATVYPLGEVVGLRYAAGTVFSVALFVAVRERLPGRRVLWRNLLRGVVVLATAACFFTAIARLPLAEAIALTFLAPLFLSVLGRTMLGEPIPTRIVAGIALGLLGVVVIGTSQRLDASHALDAVGIAAAICCAFFYALGNVLIRKQSGTDSMFTIVALSNVFVLLLVSPAMALRWEVPSGHHAAIFVRRRPPRHLRAPVPRLGLCPRSSRQARHPRIHSFRMGGAARFRVFHRGPDSPDACRRGYHHPGLCGVGLGTA